MKAYYLSGYAVECALKACISRLTKRSDFPALEAVRNSHTHKLFQLVKTAKLEDDWKAQTLVDPKFWTNWDIVKDWSEESRYGRPSLQEAEALYSAITDRKHGVLQWIRRRW